MLPLLLGVVVTATPKTVTLQLHGSATATVVGNAASTKLRVDSTCFTSAGSAKDILVVTKIGTKMGRASYTYTMDVRAQRAGTCTINFRSGADHATVQVSVTP
jgi:hypothetical protein